MGLLEVGPVSGTAPTPAARPAGTGGLFRVGGETKATAMVPGGEPVATALLLGLQERAGEDARDRKSRDRARDLVSELARLQRDLLRGALSKAGLDRLAGLARDMPLAADPALRLVVGSILLRVKVEVARYDALRRKAD